MGLFSRKPKSIVAPRTANKAVPRTDAGATTHNQPPKLREAPKPAQTERAAKIDPSPKVPKPPKPPRPAKRGKGSIDPLDFLELRSQLVDMRARLDESERARSIVEARLASLDATAAVFSTKRDDISEVTNMVLELKQQIGQRPSGGAVAESADGAHANLSAKVDALHDHLSALQDHTPKIAEFEVQIAQLRSVLERATSVAAETSAMPPPPPGVAGPDPDTLERIAAVHQRVNDLDQLRHRLGDIGDLKQRLGEIDHLHQRVSGVESLHERVGVLDSVEQRLAMVDGLAAQVAQLAERASAIDTDARAAREHVTMLDQRLTNVSTELANQLSELGRDIDGLGQRMPDGAGSTISDEVADTLRGGQVKLAKEQARYEIAFRHDLATLAEQLRRGRVDD